MSTPTVVLVHGAFAESASWNGVIVRLADRGVRSMAPPDELRSVAGDAANLPVAHGETVSGVPLAGAAHAISVSHPDEAAGIIPAAVEHVTT